ncbi:MAG: flagellar motor protein PomA [Halioglobus sp.]|nr:flagellar motor protein PomA [Halioglobus sp.]MCB1710833.1 flagellar motor protein PomA [Halioglobus sp.]MCP5120946.1 flagellar motor protein PomA [Pseudomonadales bacterium]MCP5194388.1 flagellar motor protein PomA [Pseudomonadales bacterium]
MDLATLLGLVGAIGIVLAAMMFGGSALVFVNIPSLLIVLGGTFMVVMIKFSMSQFFGAFKVAARAFIFKLESPQELITTIVNLANIARKEGMLALENEEIENEFLNEGVKMLIDGNKHDVISKVMTQDLQQTVDHHKWGAKVFTATGDVAPAMGMIGTLIGLVQMLSAMDDPKSIGPAMAVALLTTLYGALLANMVALPIADKLNLRKTEEGRIKSMCIDGVLAIQEGQNPRIIESMLKTYIEPKKRGDNNPVDSTEAAVA